MSDLVELREPIGSLPRTDVIAGTRAEVIAEIKRGSKRGEFATMSKLVNVDGYTWAVKVVRVKERPPRWRKPVIITGVTVAVLAAVCGAGWWITAPLRHNIAANGVAVTLVLMAVSAIAASALKRSLLAEVNVKIFK